MFLECRELFPEPVSRAGVTSCYDESIAASRPGTNDARRAAMMEWLMALQGSMCTTWVRESNSIWAYPTVLTLHTVGFGILVGAN